MPEAPHDRAGGRHRFEVTGYAPLDFDGAACSCGLTLGEVRAQPAWVAAVRIIATPIVVTSSVSHIELLQPDARLDTQDGEYHSASVDVREL